MIVKTTITIPIAPVTKKNSQRMIRNKRTGKYIPIPSQQFVKYQKEAAGYLPALGIDYPVNVKATYYMKTRRRVDLCNLHEALHDVLVKCGTLADDNCKIIVSTDGSRVRYDKDNPRTVVVIERSTDNENPGCL